MLKKITLFFLSIIISSVAFTQISNYTYTGGVQTFTAPSSGSYEFQLWGASGGRDGQIGGSGGYATAQMFLSLGQTVTVVVGGEGLGCNANSGGGYNGGGNAGPSGCSGGGGGATDVRVGGTALSNRMIVAGGGGGGGNGGLGVGGAGGGSTGQTASGQGGTQSSGGGGSPAGSLGQGGNKSGDGGGGGGGYYGGGAAYSDAGGGGGSGYVNSGLTNRTLIAGNLTMPNPIGGTMTGRRGTGYARITLSYSVSISQTTSVSCNGGSNGALTATAVGGTPPYTYNWSNSGTTQSITGLGAGLYSVTVTGSNAAAASASFTITEPAALSSSSAVNTNISCNGGSNGSATASATGGTTPYTYVWSNAATTASITGVIAGTYTVTVTDFNNCVSTANITITEPSLLISSIIISSCDSYTWNQNNMMYTTSGAYTDTITNALGCDSVITLNLTINNSTASSSAVTSCDSYTWNQNNMMYTTSGAYTDTITNALGCDSVITLNLIIDTLDLTITNINGSLASNEANAISYQWINCDSNNAIIAGASNQGYLPVMSGNYAVIINKGGCTDTSACVNIIITGIVERSVSAKYTIYPNPTAGNLYVELGREPEIGSTIEVYNLTGQLVQEFQIKDRKTLIDISHFEKSVYFFKYGDKMIKIILSH